MKSKYERKECAREKEGRGSGRENIVDGRNMEFEMEKEDRDRET